MVLIPTFVMLSKTCPYHIKTGKTPFDNFLTEKAKTLKPVDDRLLTSFVFDGFSNQFLQKISEIIVNPYTIIGIIFSKHDVFLKI